MRVPASSLALLKRRARHAAGYAYAPYSHFAVGAAVLTEAGEVFVGANVENASYGLSMCAERNAIHQAAAHGARRIAAIVVYTPTAEPTPPCGACRQVMSEFGVDTLVVCMGRRGQVHQHRLSELLPEAFGSGNLDSKRTVATARAASVPPSQPRRRRP